MVFSEIERHALFLPSDDSHLGLAAPALFPPSSKTVALIKKTIPLRVHVGYEVLLSRGMVFVTVLAPSDLRLENGRVSAMALIVLSPDEE